jgi:hypothetical protein
MRNVTQTRTVGPTVAPQEFNAVPDVGLKIVEVAGNIMKQNAEAKIVENLSNAQLDLNALTNQFQIDNEADPKIKTPEYEAQMKEIFDKYGASIPSNYRYAWDEKTRELSQKNALANQTWAMKQTQVNTKNSINASMRNNFQQAYIDGQNFANGDGSIIDAMANFATSKKALIEFGDKNLGIVTTESILKEYDNDSLKSFLSGVIQSNPQKGESFLQDEKVMEKLSPDDMKSMHEFARSRAKQLETKNLVDTEEAESNVMELINSDADFYTKRVQLDRAELEGKISKPLAAKARRVLSSEKAIDAVTQSPLMGEIVNQIYDINAKAGINDKDYLIGVQNIKNRILEAQESGELNSVDASKLNNQMRTLTSAKLSASTENISLFGEGSKMIRSQLPPQYQGEATRQLFYKTYGKEIKKEEYPAMAKQVIDNINKMRREKTLEKTDEAIKTKPTKEIVMSDEDFLKSIGKDMDYVKQYAAKYGKTDAEVIAALRRIKAKQ